MANYRKPVPLGTNRYILGAIVAVWMFSWVAWSDVVSIRSGSGKVTLSVPSQPEPGILQIDSAPTLERLLDSPDLFHFSESPLLGPLDIDVPPDDLGFLRVRILPGRDPDEFELGGIEEPSGPGLILWVYGLRGDASKGEVRRLEFLLLDGSAAEHQIASYSGAATATAASEDAPFATPLNLVFEAGKASAEIGITRSQSLDGIGIDLSLNTGRMRPANRTDPSKAASSTISIPASFIPDGEPIQGETLWEFFLRRLRERFEVDSGTWSSPLPEAVPVVTGGFGEWRGHIRKVNGVNIPHRNFHAGLDLRGASGTKVLASRGGVVSAHGDLGTLGHYLVIDHGDNTYSRYLHIKSTNRPPTGTNVRRGDPVGELAANSSPHLHFEIRVGPSGDSSGAPGKGVDPVIQAGFFPVLSPDSNPELVAVHIAPRSPAVEVFDPEDPVASSNASSAYVVAQVRQEQSGNYLPASFLAFSSDATPEQRVYTPTVPDIEKFLPRNDSQFGFAKYSFGHTAASDRKQYYNYWFKWGTAEYAQLPSGPRVFQVVAQNYLARNAVPSSWRLKWGPQIVGFERHGVEGESGERISVKVRAWLGDREEVGVEDLESPPWSLGKDWYQYTLPEGGKWERSGNVELSELVHASGEGASKVREESFYWKPVNPAAKPVVTITSHMAPGISHQMEVPPVVPVRASIIVASFAGTQWEGVPVPATIIATVTAPGSSEFSGSNSKLERGFPPFSEMVPTPRTFYVCSSVTGFPGRPGGPNVNRTGASSFIASTGGQFWLCASAGAFRTSGTTTSDWEYQLRYSPRDPTSGKPRLVIGTVSNSGVFVGQDVAEDAYSILFE